jgi:hypothetical protein
MFGRTETLVVGNGKMWSYQRTPDSKDNWYTPKTITNCLGHFHLDPCTSVDRSFDIADINYEVEHEDGLLKDWPKDYRVFLNPPYGRKTELWLRKMASHRNGIVLIFAKTDTEMFFKYVWGVADAVLFLKGRIRFLDESGKQGRYTSGAPSCLVAYGLENVCSLMKSGIEGKLVILMK